MTAASSRRAQSLISVLPFSLGGILLLIGARPRPLDLLKVMGLGAGNPATLLGWLFLGAP